MVLMMMTMTAKKAMMITMRRLFGYHYHNPVIIAIVIMALAVGRKLPPVVNGHAHRWRNSGYDVIEEDDFEGSTDSAYRMTSYDDDDDVDANFDPDLAYLTRCQKHRKSERTFDVSCLDDGSYNATQCHEETMECWCVDDNGDYIQDSIRKLPDRPKCQEKVRPTFTLTLVTPSKQPSTTSIINRLLEKTGIPSPNQQQLGHADPVPSEDAITRRNQVAQQSKNENEEDDDDDDDGHRHQQLHHHQHHHRHSNGDDGDDDDDEIGVKNHRDVGNHGNHDDLMKEFGDDDDDDDDGDDDDDDIDEDDDDGGDDDDDGVTQKSSNKLLRKDPVYTTGLILVVLLSSSIVIIMAVLFIHRLKRKDEGTYTLASNAIISTIGYSVSKDTEYFA